MISGLGAWPSRGARLLREPMVHFFMIGALLFLAHRLIVGNPRVIVISAGLKADLERRFRDETGRRPSPADLAAALDKWKEDEALYREALRERLDRDDATIRTVLGDKIRARAVQEMPKCDPTDAQLDAWLASHRDAYDVPLRYDFASVAFSKAEPSAESLRSSYAGALAAGANPAKLGRPILTGNLTRDQLQEKFGPILSKNLCSLPIGKWQPIESDESLLLARLNGIQGGLPSRDVLRPRLTYDWLASRQKQAVKRAVEEVVHRYRFEEIP